MSIIAGLEIGSSKIVCFIARPKNETEIEVLGMGVEYCEVLKNGHLVNVDLTTRGIEEAIKKAELMSGEEVESVFLSLPTRACQGIYSDGKVAVKEENGEREVSYNDIARVVGMAEQTVKLSNNQEIIHTLPISFKVDGNEYEEPRGTLGHLLETEVYLITCSINVLESFNRAVEEAGYKVEKYTFDMVVVGEAIFGPNEHKAKNITIDLGADYTSAVLYEKNSIRKVFSLDVGGKAVSNDLAYGLKSSFEEVERIKKEYGTVDLSLVGDDKVRVALASYNKYAEVSNKGIAQIMEARFEEIFNLIKKELLSETPKDKSKVETATSLMEAGVILVGGSAAIKGIDKLAEAVFQSPARVGFGLNFTGIDESIFQPEYAAMTGLIRWAITSDNQEEEEQESYKNPGKISRYIKNFFT